jgi:hypothetical protein
MEEHRDRYNTANPTKGFLPGGSSREGIFKAWKREWSLAEERDKLIEQNREAADQIAFEGNEVESEDEFEYAMEKLLQEHRASIARQDVSANDKPCGIRRRILEFEQALEAMAATE